MHDPNDVHAYLSVSTILYITPSPSTQSVVSLTQMSVPYDTLASRWRRDSFINTLISRSHTHLLNFLFN